MPAKQQFLVRREKDGTMRTLVAHSTRGAMKLFVDLYNPPPGEYFEVKPRGAGDWERFKVD